MSDSVTDFYDQLADDYHLIFVDWKQSIQRQAELLDRLIRAQKSAPPLTVLDCSCGIGTQAIGLAMKGHQVHATDISPAAVERLTQETQNFGVTLTTGVADMRLIDQQVDGQFDVVLSFDNALPHLLTDDDLGQAAQAIAAKIAPGGLFLASIRDYDQILLERPRSTPPQLYDDAAGRRVVFQIWDWHENQPIYTVNLFILKEIAGIWHTTHNATTYRALQRAELDAALSQAGLINIRWHMPEESGHYQPIVSAHKP
jgi:2-polyprenyl-3-methyl-5-hydroxy-6-metoxy-1,4-benzoquinol methylase